MHVLCRWKEWCLPTMILKSIHVHTFDGICSRSICWASRALYRSHFGPRLPRPATSMAIYDNLVNFIGFACRSSTHADTGQWKCTMHNISDMCWQFIHLMPAKQSDSIGSQHLPAKNIESQSIRIVSGAEWSLSSPSHAQENVKKNTGRNVLNFFSHERRWDKCQTWTARTSITFQIGFRSNTSKCTPLQRYCTARSRRRRSTRRIIFSALWLSRFLSLHSHLILCVTVSLAASVSFFASQPLVRC